MTSATFALVIYTLLSGPAHVYYQIEETGLSKDDCRDARRAVVSTEYRFARCVKEPLECKVVLWPKKGPNAGRERGSECNYHMGRW